MEEKKKAKMDEEDEGWRKEWKEGRKKGKNILS